MTRTLLLTAALLLAAPAALAQAAPPVTAASQATTLSAQEIAAIDTAVADVMRDIGTPGASIAVVRGGRLALAKAYGSARLEPRPVPASTDDRFPIGSVSKQFTAAAILLLVEDGKLKLDDPVERWAPGLTAGDRITIRQVLSHTSGYTDYWPQDYVPGFMQRPTTPQGILDGFAKRPLDYQPGADWQYSNTGFTVAGMIVEKASGQPLHRFMEARIFRPLGMTGVTEIDTGPLPASDAAGHTRYGLGPARPAPKEARGWLWAIGELAMTPSDLARWNISMMDRSLLKPESYAAQRETVKLTGGRDSRYGMGVFVRDVGGRKRIDHGGAVSGYLAENRVYPDERLAITVLVNGDFGGQGEIAERIDAVLRPKGAEASAARAMFEGLQAGRVDSARLTPSARGYFTPVVLTDMRASLGPLGAPQSFEQQNKSLRGGMTQEIYRVRFPERELRLIVRAMPDGRIEQFSVLPVAD